MDLIVQLPRQFASDLKDYLQEAGFEYQEIVLNKPGNWPEMISVAATGLAIVDRLYSWLKAKKREEPNVTIVIVTDTGTRIDLNNVSPNEAKKTLQDETSA